MSRWWINQAGLLHWGDPQIGDEIATDQQISDWQAAQITLELVEIECARRIALVVTDNQKLDLLGSMVANIILGNHADDANFLASMGWIAAMKGACAALVGKVDYQSDTYWPALPAGLAAFGAQF